MSKAVLFDLDNTLHDRDAALNAFLIHQYEERELGSLGVDKVTWVSRFSELERGGKVWKDVVYRKLCEEFQLADHETFLEEYETGMSGHVRPRPGMEDMLTVIRERGWKTGLVTNGLSGFQRRTIDAAGIEPFFDDMIISGECGFRKPSPEIFRQALDNLNCLADGSWFVGDDLEADILGASGVGMRTIWFTSEPATSPATRAVHNLADVADIVGRP